MQSKLKKGKRKPKKAKCILSEGCCQVKTRLVKLMTRNLILYS